MEPFINDLKQDASKLGDLADLLITDPYSISTLEQLVAQHERLTATIVGLLEEVPAAILSIPRVQNNRLSSRFGITETDLAILSELNDRERQAIVALKSLMDEAPDKAFTGGEIAHREGRSGKATATGLFNKLSRHTWAASIFTDHLKGGSQVFRLTDRGSKMADYMRLAGEQSNGAEA